MVSRRQPAGEPQQMQRDRHLLKQISVLTILLGSVFCGAATAAQTILRAPQDIAACLCLKQGIDAARSDLDRRKADYETARAQLERLMEEVTTQRNRVNSNDPVSVDAFKELLAQRDAAERRVASEATPAYSDSVRRHNELVDSYNANCEGKAFDAEALARVQQNLYCPR
jgi:hypothetical protein